MFGKKSSVCLAILLGLISLSLACGNDQRVEANKLINEANALLEKFRPLSDKASDQMNDLMGSKMTQAEDLEEYKTDNKAKFDEIISLSEQCEKSLSEAAGKFEQASNMQIDAKFKEYVSLKSQELKKRAEKSKSRAALIKAFLAEKDAAKLNQLSDDYNKKDTELLKEADDLGAKAEKIVKDNPSLFKPN